MSVVKSPKIAIVGPSAPPLGAGGVASSHYQLYRCFRNRGLNAVLLTFEEQEARIADPEILRFGASSRERAILALCSALYLKAKGSCKQAYQLIDILASIPGVLRMNRALRQLKPDHIIIPDQGAPGLFLEKGGARLIMVSHHNPARFENPLFGDFCPIDIRQAVSLEQHVLKKVDAVIAPSRYMETVFKETFSFDGPVTTIHNPLYLPFVDQVVKNDIRMELGLPDGSPVVYIPSAGSRLKGERFVVEIVRRLADACTGMLGFYLSGNLPAGLAEELLRVPENVRIYSPGHLDYPDNLALMKACNFGVSPTLIENFGMAILEAGFCGLPMVAFRVGGVGEIISDGENGFCVPYMDIEALIAAAERLLDAGYCQEMGEAASHSARRRFDAEAIVDHYLEFCQIAAYRGI